MGNSAATVKAVLCSQLLLTSFVGLRRLTWLSSLWRRHRPSFSWVCVSTVVMATPALPRECICLSKVRLTLFSACSWKTHILCWPALLFVDHTLPSQCYIRPELKVVLLPGAVFSIYCTPGSVIASTLSRHILNVYDVSVGGVCGCLCLNAFMCGCTV